MVLAIKAFISIIFRN